jgi:hypothetical protein
MSLTDDWHVSSDHLLDGEWYRWDRPTAEDNASITEAVADFDAGGRNAKAAAAANAWFKHEAIHEAACVTRLLVVNGHIAAFYALSSAEAALTSSSKLERMGVLGGSRLGASHLEWIGRDRRAPAGAGELAVKHAIYVAKKVAELQGNRALTLDPFDAETQEMWKSKGFHVTQTDLDGGLRRLYIPLFGSYYGKMKR